MPALPAQPPEGARRADALDVEKQIITASLDGAVAWVKTPDCIANQVELHRDDHAKGTDLWGEDASTVDENGIGKGLSKFFPAWYNTLVGLKTQLPPAVFSDPLSDETEAAVEVPASKKLLPHMFDRTERKLEIDDYYLIAEQMANNEIHGDIRSVLDAIAALLPQKDAMV